MDRGGFLRFLLLSLAGLFLFMALRSWFGDGNGRLQPLTTEPRSVPEERAPDRRCDLWSPLFHAQVRTQGGTLTHFKLLTEKYTRDGEPLDLSTTPDPGGEHEFRQPLFASWRGEGDATKENVPWNVVLDSVDYRIERADGKTCELTYRDDEVELSKVIRVTERPYELEVTTAIRNLADEQRAHALTFDTIDWRLDSEVEGKMFRISPYVTHVEFMPREGDGERLLPKDFEPDDFTKEPFAPTVTNPRGEWYELRQEPDFVAVSNAYFSKALVPLDGPTRPVGQLQIEYRWDHTRYDSRGRDPNAGAMYRARLAYPPQVLAAGESAEYTTLAFVGPKERAALATAAGGEHRLTELIDLGFFASIAKVLVAFLLQVHSIVPNWGLAIIILTVTARILLFPLSWPSIKNMVRMRELKPEMDALNEKFKDDPRARGLAQMELWRKHKVNPFKGCLPQLASMPVWFALYTTLQTAVELYNIPFLWFPDLSERDPLFILPFIIGGVFFLQQKLMPIQGGDPMQQKMMRYFMPGMFTVFMLFLPAGLGVYMFTNSVLAIGQQWLVEWHARRSVGGRVAGGPGKGGDIEVKVKEDRPSGAATAGKGKKKSQQRPKGGKRAAEGRQKLSEGRPLLDKGKA